MRDRPFRVDAVATEAAAEVIVDAAFGHSRERRAHHRERFRVARHRERAQAELELGGVRKLRGGAETAMHRVERRFQLGQGHAGRARGQARSLLLDRLERLHRIGRPLALFGNRLALLAIRLGDARRDIDEARSP